MTAGTEVKPMNNVRITDIARALHVAPSTVSRALSDPDKVAQKTREQILDYIEKTGYRPNISARALRSKQTSLIGLVLNDLSDSLIANAASVMMDRAFERGYFPILLATGETDEKEP